MAQLLGFAERRRWVAVALVVAAASVAAGCGGSGAGGEDFQGSTSNAGIPPQPLGESYTVKVALPARIEAFASVLLADAMGEFAKENLEIDYVTMPSTDALPALGAGRVDVDVTNLNAGAFNAIASGVPIQGVAPVVYQNSPKDGLWVAQQYVGCSPECLTGKKIASAVGVGTGAILSIQHYLSQAGVNVGEVQIVQFPTADVPLALKNGVVAAGWLLAPAPASIEREGIAKHVWTQEAGGTGMTYFGPTLLEQRRDVGAAFVRALARANRLYLEGDYQNSPEVVSALAEMMDVPESAVLATPPHDFSGKLKFDESKVAALQQLWLKYYPDILKYKDPISTEKMLDMSFVEACCR